MPCRSVEDVDDLKMGLCPMPRMLVNHRRLACFWGLGQSPSPKSTTPLHFCTAKPFSKTLENQRGTGPSARHYHRTLRNAAVVHGRKTNGFAQT